ncbi:MAG: class I SAM-dependent methyltransferase [Ignavibacteriales bacterium]
MLDSKGFDIWSEDYEKYVKRNSKGYPFEGYYDVLNYMYNLIKRKNGSRILDIGIGTGFLSNQLYKIGAEIYGIDFSAKMIGIAQEKMPNAKLYLCDFNNGLPIELSNVKFDYIISSYAIHHLDHYKKILFIKQLYGMLNNNGSIIIGDVAFQNNEELQKCRISAGNSWDNDESYIVVNIISSSLNEVELKSNYKQISVCSGVLEIY